MLSDCRSALALALIAVLGCGGGGPVEPPPPSFLEKDGIVELKTDRIMVFTGKSIPIASLVARVTDAQGRVLTAYTLSTVASGGCTAAGDSLVASGKESVCTIKVRAKYQVPSGSTGANFASASFTAAVADTTVVTSAIDLKAHRWKASFRCTAPGNQHIMTDANVFIDSLNVRATVDSVRYASDSSWIRNFGGVAQMWMSGPAIRWLRDGTVDTITYRNQHTIHRQAPDTLLIGYSNQDLERPSQRVDPLAPLLRYEGGTWCSHSWNGRRGQLTLQEF